MIKYYTNKDANYCGDLSSGNVVNDYPGDIWYARAYLVYTIDGIEHTVYGSLTEIKA